MTPAEKPKDPARNFGLNFLDKKAIRLPTPVANPANIVKPNANKKFPDSIFFLLLKCTIEYLISSMT